MSRLGGASARSRTAGARSALAECWSCGVARERRERRRLWPASRLGARARARKARQFVISCLHVFPLTTCAWHARRRSHALASINDQRNVTRARHFAWHFSPETRRITLLRSAPCAIGSFATTDETGGRSMVSGPLFFAAQPFLTRLPRWLRSAILKFAETHSRTTASLAPATSCQILESGPAPVRRT
jgi:hypothetical protein